MNLLMLLIFGGTAVLYAALLPAKWRETALLAGSILAVYWLQPFSPIRFSGYLLPTAAIGLTVLGWWVTLPGENEPQRRKGRQENLNEESFAPSAPLRLKKKIAQHYSS